VATTRNLALERVTGELVQLLDHDDILLPGALKRLIELFETRSTHWAVGQADDLVEDVRKPFASALPYGVVKAGAVNEWAIDNHGNWPIHCAGLMIRTDTLRAIGGWPAIITDDDVAMFAALSEVAAGYNEQTVTWLYRITAEQQSKTEFWQANSHVGRLYALQRAKAIKETGLRLDTATVGCDNQDPGAGPLKS
jgi:cellulose synthase/poly-beta-1,6-N-acetylglucosamine synthase-like glycosyltransferase